MAGSREKAWGREKKYSDSVQRADDLFFEYVRLVRGLKPKVFVAENVTGLVRGKAIGYFKTIMTELRSSGYVVGAKVLDASYLGVPQARQRLILIGVRLDLSEKHKLVPVFPTPMNTRYLLRDILVTNDKRITHDPETNRDITLDAYALGVEYDKIRIGEQSDKYFQLVRPALNKPIGTITATGGNVGAASVTHPIEKRKFTLGELRALSSFPEDFVLTGTYEQRWERIGRSVPPLMMKAVAESVRVNVLDKIL